MVEAALRGSVNSIIRGRVPSFVNKSGGGSLSAGISAFATDSCKNSQFGEL